MKKEPLTKSDLLSLLQRATNKRKHLTLDTLRLCDGFADDLEGLVIDRFKSCLLVHLYEQSLVSGVDQNLSQAMSDLAQQIGVSSVYLRRHQINPRSSAKPDAQLIFGEETKELIIEDDGVKYLVDPVHQVNAGFFIDMREVRLMLKRLALGKRVLNTFCFTGSLGITAYVGGASEVVQVDVSKKILSWAKRNFELNQNTTGNMRFIEEDASIFLARELRRIERGQERYDIVIIDAPAFGASDGRRFVFEKDIEKLLNSALSLLDTKGSIFLSTNQLTVSVTELKEIIKRASLTSAINIQAIDELPRPFDFPSDPSVSPVMRGVRVEIK